MATFSSAGFSRHTFSVNSTGGAHPVGGGGYDNTGWEDLFLRPVKLGRDRVKVDDERELVEIVAERITDDGELDWSGGMPVFESAPAVDWAAVERWRGQSERLNQEIVLEAIRRVIEAVRKAEDEDDDRAAELLLLN